MPAIWSIRTYADDAVERGGEASLRPVPSLGIVTGRGDHVDVVAELLEQHVTNPLRWQTQLPKQPAVHFERRPTEVFVGMTWQGHVDHQAAVDQQPRYILAFDQELQGLNQSL